jgi:anti-anti-sigma factor
MSVNEGDEVQVSVSVDRDGDVLTVAVSGDVDLATGPVVDRAITEALATDGVSAVRVDLSAVEFLDSTGVALLLRGRRRADERGLGYLVTGADGIPRQVLELTGVWTHLCGDSDRDRTSRL